MLLRKKLRFGFEFTRFAANSQSCLVAVVPFEEKRVYRLPFKAIEVWKHDQSFDATPLLSKDFAPFVWQSICEKLIADKYVPVSYTHLTLPTKA